MLRHALKFVFACLICLAFSWTMGDPADAITEDQIEQMQQSQQYYIPPTTTPATTLVPDVPDCPAYDIERDTTYCEDAIGNLVPGEPVSPPVTYAPPVSAPSYDPTFTPQIEHFNTKYSDTDDISPDAIRYGIQTGVITGVTVFVLILMLTGLQALCEKLFGSRHGEG